MQRRWFEVMTMSVATATVLGCGKSEPKPEPTPATSAPATTAAEADAAPTTATAPATTVAENDAGGSAPAGCVVRDVYQPLTSIAPDHAALEGDSLTLCGQTEEPAGWCFSVDFASGKVEGAKQPDDDLAHVANYLGALNDPFRRKDSEPVLQLCLDAATGCKDVYVGETTSATLTSDEKRFVLTTLDDRERRVRIFDATTFAEIGNHLIEKDADLPDCSFGVAAAGNLVMSTGPCGVEAAGHKAWLANATTGEKIADIGGAEGFDLRFGGYAKVSDDVWAFRDGAGTKVVMQNVKTGAVQATADLSAAGPPGKGATWLFATSEPARVVAVENRPQTGAVYLIDPATGALTKSIVPAACP